MEHLVKVMGDEPDCIREETEARPISQPRRLYIVRGKASHGLITYMCPNADMALDSLKRFRREEVQDLLVLNPDGCAISPADLEAFMSGGVPSDAVPLAIGS